MRKMQIFNYYYLKAWAWTRMKNHAMERENK